jgi:DNA polymerase elongation subunit (family B)
MESILLFKIEVLFDDKFPQATKREDEINRINCLFVNGDKETHYLLTTFSIPDVSVSLNINHQQFTNELELIFGFGNLIKTLDPKIITGYNIKQFDFNYIYDRLLNYNDDEYNEANLKKYYNLEWIEIMFRSDALGSNFHKYYKYKNCNTIDLYETIRNKYKLKSYIITKVLNDLLKIDIVRRNIKEVNEIFKLCSDNREIIIREEMELLNYLKDLYQFAL